jgi:hypothetical protein
MKAQMDLRDQAMDSYTEEQHKIAHTVEANAIAIARATWGNQRNNLLMQVTQHLILNLYLMRMMWILYSLEKNRVLKTPFQSNTSQHSINLPRYSKLIIRLLGPVNKNTTIREHILSRDCLRALCPRWIFMISMEMIQRFG